MATLPRVYRTFIVLVMYQI